MSSFTTWCNSDGWDFWYEIFLTIGTWSVVSQRLWVGRSALEVALQAGMQSMSLPMFSKPILGTFLTSWDQTKKARYEMFELVPALGDHYVTNVIVPPAFSSFSEWVSEARTRTRHSNDRTWIRKKYHFFACLDKSLDILQSWAEPGLCSDFFKRRHKCRQKDCLESMISKFTPCSGVSLNLSVNTEKLFKIEGNRPSVKHLTYSTSVRATMMKMLLMMMKMMTMGRWLSQSGLPTFRCP